MEIESISNKLSNPIKNMRGYFNTSPLNEKSLYLQGFSLLFHTKLSRLSLAKLHTQRFAVAVSFRRKLLTLRQLSHGQNICFYFADASARTSSDTASTWCICGLKRFGEPFEDYLHFTNKLTHST